MRNECIKGNTLEISLLIVISVLFLSNLILLYLYEYEKRTHLEIENELICRIDKGGVK